MGVWLAHHTHTQARVTGPSTSTQLALTHATVEHVAPGRKPQQSQKHCCMPAALLLQDGECSPTRYVVQMHGSASHRQLHVSSQQLQQPSPAVTTSARPSPPTHTQKGEIQAPQCLCEGNQRSDASKHAASCSPTPLWSLAWPGMQGMNDLQNLQHTLTYTLLSCRVWHVLQAPAACRRIATTCCCLDARCVLMSINEHTTNPADSSQALAWNT
jgi:hypothetical protein